MKNLFCVTLSDHRGTQVSTMQMASDDIEAIRKAKYSLEDSCCELISVELVALAEDIPVISDDKLKELGGVINIYDYMKASDEYSGLSSEAIDCISLWLENDAYERGILFS